MTNAEKLRLEALRLAVTTLEGRVPGFKEAAEVIVVAAQKYEAFLRGES